jgi:hypothetical protein
MPLRFTKEVFFGSIKNIQKAFSEKCFIYLIPTDAYSGQTSLSLCFKEGVHPEKIEKRRVKEFLSG